jgi:hypothetical protein
MCALYSTFKVTVVVRDNVPEVAVTVMVELPAGVPVGLWKLSLHPATPRTTDRTMTAKPPNVTAQR